MEGARDALRSSIPWITLSATAALTFAAWIGVERSRLDEARAFFERQAQAAEVALRSRLLGYEHMTRAAAAFVTASPNVTRKGWHDFVAQLDLDERFPGVKAIGFAERVPAAARTKHVQRVRAEGIADYAIAPAGERPQYFPISLSEPAGARDARAVGFDVFSEPVRRAAMERARDSGEAAITPRILLATGAQLPAAPVQPGFILYVPAFRADARPTTADARADALAGFACVILRASDVMRDVLDEAGMRTLDMRVVDGSVDRGGGELFDSRGESGVARAPAAFSRQIAFPLGGRTWTVVFSSRPEYDALVASRRPWTMLASGLTGSLLLFILTAALVGTWNRAHQLSIRDPLTGLYNRRYLEETIGRELPRARRHRESVGVIALDIDHFKQLNDTFGHDAGDFVLRMLAEQLRAHTRDSDIACRFGGEEFGIVLPGASLEVARSRAEALRAAIESLRLEFEGKSLGPCTISAGVASMPPHAQDWTYTLQTADRALYSAKQQGRNRVVAAS